MEAQRTEKIVGIFVFVLYFLLHPRLVHSREAGRRGRKWNVKGVRRGFAHELTEVTSGKLYPYLKNGL